MKEYGELEKQMKKALTDLEKREKQLSTKEQEVSRTICFFLLITRNSFFIDSTNANRSQTRLR